MIIIFRFHQAYLTAYMKKEKQNTKNSTEQIIKIRKQMMRLRLCLHKKQ